MVLEKEGKREEKEERMAFLSFLFFFVVVKTLVRLDRLRLFLFFSLSLSLSFIQAPTALSLSPSATDEDEVPPHRRALMLPLIAAVPLRRRHEPPCAGSVGCCTSSSAASDERTNAAAAAVALLVAARLPLLPSAALPALLALRHQPDAADQAPSRERLHPQVGADGRSLPVKELEEKRRRGREKAFSFVRSFFFDLFSSLSHTSLSTSPLPMQSKHPPPFSASPSTPCRL